MDSGVDGVTSPPKLLDRVRYKIRLRHYSLRTEQAYLDWIRRLILFHGKRHPESLGAPDVEAFLTHLAVDRKVAAATQNLAKSSILFLYRDVLERDLPWLQNVERARTPARLPVVLTQAESRRCSSAFAAFTRSSVGCSMGAACGSWKGRGYA